MVLLDQMAKLVDDFIIDAARCGLDQIPVEGNGPSARATPPAVFHPIEAQTGIAGFAVLELLCAGIKFFGKKPMRLPKIPTINHPANVLAIFRRPAVNHDIRSLQGNEKPIVGNDPQTILPVAGSRTASTPSK